MSVASYQPPVLHSGHSCAHDESKEHALTIPAHIMARFVCRDISAQQAIVLTKIEELTSPHTACTAGNQWLANWAGISRQAMKHRLSKLRSKLLLRQDRSNARRRMAPSWIEHPLVPTGRRLKTWTTSRGKPVEALTLHTNILQLLRRHIVSPDNALLLALIESLSRNRHGYCYASNGQLGFMVRRKRNSIKTAIYKLKSMGLIKIHKEGKIRRMVPYWMHLPCLLDHELVRRGELPGPGPLKATAESLELENDLIHWAKSLLLHAQHVVTGIDPSGHCGATLNKDYYTNEDLIYNFLRNYKSKNPKAPSAIQLPLCGSLATASADFSCSLGILLDRMSNFFDSLNHLVKRKSKEIPRPPEKMQIAFE